jgi:GntR family transcriptional repressor for pyruvate dehydrogenase complex
MARQSLVSMVSDNLLDRIIAGEFPPGASLPGELELTAEHEVSRLTVREAVKTLEAQSVVRIERGRGTFVNPVSRWESMDMVLRAATEAGDNADASIQLIEVRRMLETGAAELAATHITPNELDSLQQHLTSMQESHDTADLTRFVEADLAFHNVILHASGNVFLAVMFEPLARVIAARREQTSRVPQIQVNAIREHAGIITALASGSAESARLAMDSHMEQTMRDLKTYVLKRD